MQPNRKPPYSITGGVYDTLSASNGLMYSVTNKEAEEAMELFKHQEGCDLHPASGIALGALVQAVKSRQVGASAHKAYAKRSARYDQGESFGERVLKNFPASA